MKKILLAAALGALVSSSAFADTVTLNYSANNGGGGGGAFNAITGLNGTFDTFCIEENEFFSPGGNYFYQVSGAAVAGGINVGGGNPGGNPDPISIGTAYLYRQAISNTLSGYSWASPANQAELQRAIWMLEGEIVFAANTYITAASTALSLSVANLQNDSSGAYGISVMNIWNNPNYTGSAQDMLIAVPDGGMTVSLLGLSLSGLAFVRRKLR